MRRSLRLWSRAAGLLATSIVLAGLTGCGGGGGNVAVVPPSVPQSVAKAALTIRIRVTNPTQLGSATHRSPQYVSVNSQSASISVNGATPVIINLTATSPGCVTAANGSLSCGTSVSAPIGVDTLAIALYSGTNATGSILSQGQTSTKVVAGVANSAVLALNGVIASLSLGLSNGNPPQGTAAQIGLTVNFLDASGAAIIGTTPFTTPVLLTDSDTSGATTLSQTTIASPASGSSLSIRYTGAALPNGATIGASAGSILASTVTLLPQGSVVTPTFNDYVTFGYDNARDVFNPNSTAFTPSALPNLHLAWQTALGGGDYNTQTQPILATEIPGHAGVLFVGGGSGHVYGYDALSGTLLWTRALGQETYNCENGNTIYFGVGGSAAYDPSSQSLYIVGNSNSGSNTSATNSFYRLSGSSGAITGQVNFATPSPDWPSLDFSHTSVTLGRNGLAYIGTGATCDISSWRGRVAAINVGSMALAQTFFTVWDPNNARGGGAQPWGGGGVWGWGGVSIDQSGNVFTGVGNTDNGSTTHGAIVTPFAAAPSEESGLGDALVELSSDLSTVENAHHPVPQSSISGLSADLDLQGTPTIFQPSGAGCDPMLAVQGKSGSVYLYDATAISKGPLVQYQLAPSTYADGFLGGPAYSSVTGLLYVSVPSSNESLFAPGMVAINPGCDSPSIIWQTAFGPDSYAPGNLTSPGLPRSVPAVSAGGIVFVGTPCAPSGNSCSSMTTADSVAHKQTQGSARKPLICCTPTGTGGGALWALDASTGAVLNGGNPVIITSGPIRMPPTIDGDWLFVLDNSGNLYALTLDPAYAATSTKERAVDTRMLKLWEPAPHV